MARGTTTPTIQEQQRLFFERLGHALGQWQLVEMQLFRVFARLMRCENAQVASAAFHSVISFATRLDMTEAAAKVGIADQAMFSRWHALHNRAVKRSKRRNLLAHFIVIYGVNAATVAEHGPFLQPSIFDVTRQPAPRDTRLDGARIKAIGASFERLSNDLRLFADSLPVPASSLGRLI